MRHGVERRRATTVVLLVGVGALLAAGCRTEPEPRELGLATFDSVLVELGGPATAALDRGQRWRMISSTGGGLPPISYAPDLLPEQGSQGARLVQIYCVQCHGLPVPHMHTADEWPIVLRRMVLRTETLSKHMGGELTERLLGEMRMAGMAATDVPTLAERDTLLTYLQRHAFPGAETGDLPDEPGRELYIRRCSTCHATPAPDAHDAEGWRAVVTRMQGNISAMDAPPLTEEERQRILDYLQAAAR